MTVSVTHVAGPRLLAGNRIIQRCAHCGKLLRDNRGARQGPAFKTWIVGRYVRVVTGGGVRCRLLPESHPLPFDYCGEGFVMLRACFFWFIGPLLRWWNGARSRDCPRCGYELGDLLFDRRWYKVTDCGRSFDGERCVYWMEGVQTCPRCRHRFEAGDSD